MLRRWARAATMVGASLGVAAIAGTERGRRVDRRLFEWVNAGHGGKADALFTGLTELGSIGASIGAAAVLVAAGRRRAGFAGLGAASTMWIVGQGLKRWYVRPRPYEGGPGARLLIGRPNGSSWPSSHPAVLLSFVAAAGRELRLAPAARAGLAGLASVVALSRVYVGVHHPSDVVGGLLLGRAVAEAWPSSAPPLQ